MADLTTQILIEIRDEIRKTNARLDHTNARLDGTNERLDSLTSRFDRLERRQVQAEVRVSTEIVGVMGAIDRLTEAMLDPGSYAALAARVADHERRIGVLETR